MRKSISPQTESPISTLVQLTIWAAYSSAIFAAIGLVFLTIFFSGVSIFGPLNDVAVILQYILLLPIMVTLWRMLKPYGRKLNNFALVVGIAGTSAVIVLQTLLVLRVIPFEVQILLVIPAFLIAMLWFVLTGYLGRTDDRIPKGTGLHILAGLVFAYPIWAFKLGNNLQRLYRGGH
jgi:hypothetical protein